MSVALVRDGDDRFTIRETLGSGAVGVVYRAFDHRLGRDVALKRLRNATARDIYRFKREFRALADIVHPNLITLHELHTSGDEWFFTMELVNGVPFIDWVRHRTADSSGSSSDPTRPASQRPRHQIIEAELDRARLDAALPQLVDGVLALHLAGKVHRDLKPSNILVTPDGRVVLLDFGLVSDLSADRNDPTHEQAAVGTPAYMSPEQAADLPLSEASDWYAVGVVLYEALTGRRPFEGSNAEMLERKQLETPVRPRDLASGVSRELDELCMRLLACNPADRPGGRAVLAALGRSPSEATLHLEQAVAVRPFVGRTDELDVLRRALTDSRERAVAVFVRGESGIGKTHLVRHFLHELQEKALVLEGRCYERESMPFEALDSVIDAATSVLLRMRDDQVRAGLPPGIAALVRLFPALRRVPAIAKRCIVAPLPAGAQEVRRRAAEALRALLGWLAARQPLVIAIDDLQWGDADSAVFLHGLLHSPQPLPLLLILIHRPHDDAGVIAALRAAEPSMPPADLRTIELTTLPDRDARRLARTLSASEQTAEALVRESGGHPLFLIELARGITDPGGTPPTLDELIRRRQAALPPPAAALLRTIAVAGRPLALRDAAQAAGLDDAGAELPLLVAEHLVQVRHLGDAEITHVEAYHDRIRDAAVASVGEDELRRIHDALRWIYEQSGDPGDLASLVAHALATGDLTRVARYAAPAAEIAERALAFHRAAELYGLALVDPGGDAAQRRRLQRRRGEALANAGRLDEAAAAFAEAARGADQDEALDLDRLRLEQLLRCGRLVEGLELARRLLARIGVTLPAARPAVMRALIAQRLRLRIRGYQFTERRELDVPPALLRRIDLLAAVAMAISVADPILGLLVQGHHLRAAFDAGEPRRACVALAIELGYLGVGGVRARRRIDRLATQVRALAERVGHPYITGVATGMEGMVSFQLGNWQTARMRLEAGIRTMCEHGTGVRWELDVAMLFHLGALTYLGETGELVRQMPMLLRDAMDRGDVFAQHGLRAWRPNLVWLILDRPGDARAHVLAVEAARPPADEPQIRDYYELASHTQIDLYQGDAETAWRRLETGWPRLGASYLLRIESVRVEGMFLRARAAIAWALVAPAEERDTLVSTAAELARDLERERAPWAQAFGLQVRAMIAATAGDRRTAIEQLDAAFRAFIALDMNLHATVAQLRLGELEDGVIGEAHATAARRAMTAQAIVDPDAMARLIGPWPAAAVAAG